MSVYFDKYLHYNYALGIVLLLLIQVKNIILLDTITCKTKEN